jgi:hypothetical protein
MKINWNEPAFSGQDTISTHKPHSYSIGMTKEELMLCHIVQGVVAKGITKPNEIGDVALNILNHVKEVIQFNNELGDING